MSKPLSKKHRKFVDEYLKCFNQTEAYLVVYPSSTYDAARANSSRLIATDSIKSEIELRIKESLMSADEALQRLSGMGRSDIADYLNDFGGVDLEYAKESGITKYIRKLKSRTITSSNKDGETDIHTEEIELYSAHEALRDILKIHGKFKELGSQDNPIKIVVEYANGNDD